MDKWLNNTNVVRIVALVLAIMLWGIVHMERMNGGATTTTGGGTREDKINEVSITPKYDAGQYHISSLEPSKVTVVLTGRDSALKKVSTASYQILLDLTNAKEGDLNLPLRASGFPSGVQVQIIPSTVKVVLERQERKEVPVKINVKGSPAPGLKAGQPIVQPNKVNVTLPVSRLDDVDSVYGEISIDKATSAVTKQVKLQAVDKNSHEVPIDISPPIVDVEVPVTSPFKTIPLQLRFVGEPAPGYSIAAVTPEKDKVTVFGTQAALEKLDFYQGPDIDLTGLNQSKDMTVPIPLRGDVQQVDPQALKLHIEVAPKVTKTLENVPVSVIGQNEAYDAKIVTPDNARVSVLLEGADTAMAGLKPEDVQAIVNVSNLAPGRHEVPIMFNLPAFVRQSGGPQLRATVDIAAKPAAAAAADGAGGGSPGGEHATQTPSTDKPPAPTGG